MKLIFGLSTLTILLASCSMTNAQIPFDPYQVPNPMPNSLEPRGVGGVDLRREIEPNEPLLRISAPTGLQFDSQKFTCDDIEPLEADQRFGQFVAKIKTSVNTLHLTIDAVQEMGCKLNL